MKNFKEADNMRERKTFDEKVDREVFERVSCGDVKTWGMSCDDEYRVGDVIRISETIEGELTGRNVKVEITYITRRLGCALMEMGIQVMLEQVYQPKEDIEHYKKENSINLAYGVDVKEIKYTCWGDRTILCMITLEDGQEFIGSAMWCSGDYCKDEDTMMKLAKHKAGLKVHEYVTRGMMADAT